MSGAGQVLSWVLLKSRTRLGLGVSRDAVHAVQVRGGRIVWAGRASFERLTELAEIIARLAGECTPAVGRVVVALGRDLAQVRTVLPAPPLRGARLRRYVALDAPRLFRMNGTPLVCDATRVIGPDGQYALWAAAVEPPLLEAILDGCGQAGLAVESIGPAADVLPSALRPDLASSALRMTNGGGMEVVDLVAGAVWRSRWRRAPTGSPPPPGEGEAAEHDWAEPLAHLGPDAAAFAPAYGAAVGRMRLDLIPPQARAARARRARHNALRLLAVGAGLWIAAGVAYSVRLTRAAGAVERELAALGPELDGALRVRRDLMTARGALDALDAAERSRSRHLDLLAQVTGALPDSTVLVALSVGPDGTVRVAGHSPQAARALAAIDRVRWLRNARLEGAVIRESVVGVPGREWDRFAIAARLVRQP